MRELLQVLGVRVVIGGKVGLEHAQLVVFERRPQPFRLLLLLGDLLLLVAAARSHHVDAAAQHRRWRR